MKKRMLLIAAAALAACRANAQMRRMAFGGMHSPDISASVKVLPPREIVAGEPFAFDFSLSIPAGTSVEPRSAEGLPFNMDGVEFLGQENLPDGVSTNSAFTVKRFRLVFRSSRPFSAKNSVSLSGMSVHTVTSAGGASVFTSSTSFSVDAGKVSYSVAPLPEEGRPDSFSGAVGTGFQIASRFEKPDSAWPGNWSTAIYELQYNGWMPSNAVPRISGLERGFEKIHPLEAGQRQGSGRMSWRQTMMPRDISSTNGPVASIVYFDTRTRRYELAQSRPARLAFRKPEPPPEPPPEIGISGGADGRAILRFAPSIHSPATVSVPKEELSGARTTETRGAWRRVETPSGAGWISGAAR